MDNNSKDLIARYIYAVTRQLPAKMRVDVEQELDGLIADMLEQRCKEITPTEQDVRVVLAELGSPEELALKYCGEEDKALISGVLFMLYKRTLRLALPIIAAINAVGSILSAFLGSKPKPQPLIFTITLTGQAIGSAFLGAFLAFALITLVFAILERQKTKLRSDALSWKLPPVPKKQAQIKPEESIFSIILMVLVTILFIGFPQIIAGWFEGVGWIPALATSVIRSFWPALILWALLDITKEIAKLTEGRYCLKITFITLVVNILILVSTAFVFLNDRIMNPAFVSRLSAAVTQGGDFDLLRLIPRLNVIFFALICLALVIETITVAVRGVQEGKQEAEKIPLHSHNLIK